MLEAFMSPEIFIKRSLAADSVVRADIIQSLWSGYGEIVRYQVAAQSLSGSSVILKTIRLDQVMAHPRGWQSERSHQRKLTSYRVEAHWYANWSDQVKRLARIPICYAVHQTDDLIYILLEDMDEAGFPRRYGHLEWEACLPILDWLANFHSRFIGVKSTPDNGLWPRGTYWHLATRPDEWQAMVDGELKDSASRIDEILSQARFQTLLHGDAKVANFCFSELGDQVAAVDFQYIGRGVGVQDVAYFLGSCLDEASLTEHLSYLLEYYYAELARCLVAQGESADLASEVCVEWRSLFDIAWADFHRFILGWSPTHAKNTAFSQMVTARALALLRSS
ncbi:oxidoreductase family protein [Marinomonas posidonica]|uniref:CHK kinase-like domain-containing protein n=1 Tax=Marinomonas posidonica (strain CECT 7376 / NCIMB 14433 / IVIA-Po-181) TaxID=491952 RepID=F6CTT7_MARPP|nr:oxidoreductase family protein [Marinomonas posidonica]AEF56306.1 protein of unknown function DUF227 [Marinomonas posidonica IVIA-Po-181]